MRSWLLADRTGHDGDRWWALLFLSGCAVSVLESRFSAKHRYGRHLEDSAYRIFYSVVAIELVVALVDRVSWNLGGAAVLKDFRGKRIRAKLSSMKLRANTIALIALPFASVTSVWPLFVLAFIAFPLFRHR